MAHKFNEDEKAVREFSERIGFGVHKVQFVLAEAGETEAGKEYMEIQIVSAEGIEDAARVWFVGGATNISFNTLRQIAVHNGKDEAAKEKMRLAVENVADSDALASLLNENCIGGEMWLTKYYDPSRTYQNQAGENKRSINTNIYGYEPVLKPELMPQQVAEGGNANFPGGEAATGDAAANVPKDWS